MSDGGSNPSAVPLVRFGSGDDAWLQVKKEGLDVLRALPPPVQIVAVLGRGRSGKSTTCSHLVRQEPGDKDSPCAFPVGHTPEPVTEGADIAAWPLANNSGFLLVVDCEGSDNPSTVDTSQYHALALLVFALASKVVHCEQREIPDRCFQDLAATAASRELLMTEDIDRHTPDLFLLVTDPRWPVLRTPGNQLQKILDDGRVEGSRRDERDAIKHAFRNKKQLVLADLRDASYVQDVTILRQELLADWRPASSGGLELSGADIAAVLAELCSKVSRWSRDTAFRAAIEPDSAFTNVLKARLEAAAARQLETFQLAVPLSDHWSDTLAAEAKIAAALASFDEETRSVATSKLHAEIRMELEKRLQEHHRAALARNMEHLAAEERVAAAVVEVLHSAFQQLLPAIPLPQPLSEEGFEALKSRQKEHFAACDKQLGSLRCRDVKQRATKELGSKIAPLLSEVEEAQTVACRIATEAAAEAAAVAAAAAAEAAKVFAEQQQQRKLQQCRRRLMVLLMVALCVSLFYATAAGWISPISSIVATCRQKRSMLCHAVLPVSEWFPSEQGPPAARKNDKEDNVWHRQDESMDINTDDSLSLPANNAAPQQSPANVALQQRWQQQQQQCFWADSPGFWSRLPPTERQKCTLDGSSSDRIAEASSEAAAGGRSKGKRVRRWLWKLPRTSNLGRDGNTGTFWAFRKGVAPWFFGAFGLGAAAEIALCVAPHW